MLYPGQIEKAAGTDYQFQPLLKSGFISGLFSYFQMVQRTFMGLQVIHDLPYRPDARDYVLAAHIQGPKESSDAEVATQEIESNSEESSGEETDEAPAPAKPLDVVIIADLDFISEQFFQIRAGGLENLNFDNITFFLNSIDVLVGDESFITLRSKRVRHRTLERVEEQTRNFNEERVKKEEEAEVEAEQALAEAQQRLTEKVDEVRQRPDLDTQTKQIMAQNIQEVESRRLEVLKTNIEAEKEAKINSSKENMEEQIRRIQGNIKTFAVLLPPIPVFALGVLIFVRRQRREREGAAAARRLRA